MAYNVNKLKNVKVELLRIIGCFAVIWYHIRQLPFKENGDLSETNVFFECICTICVMTFFLISGFFIYDKKGNIIKDWLSIIKKFFINVFIPFIFVVIFTIIFHEFLISRETFIYCLNHINLNKIFFTIFDSFKNFSCDYLPGTAAHLWYIFSYMIIIFVYPITRFILKNFQRVYIYIILTIISIFMIINDYYLFFGNPIYNKIFEILHKPIYYSAVGYILYHDILVKYIDDRKNINNKKSFNIIINKPIFYISIILYIVTFILLFKTQCLYDLGVNGPYVYTSWLSFYSLVLTSSFFIIIYDIDIERFINEKNKKLLFYLSDKTLGIYLIHYLFITKFLSNGLQVMFQTGFSYIWQYFLYFILYGLFIFIVSLLFLILLEFILKKIISIIVRR